MCFHEADSFQIGLHILMGLIMMEISSMAMGLILNLPMNMVMVVIMSLVVICGSGYACGRNAFCICDEFVSHMAVCQYL